MSNQSNGAGRGPFIPHEPFEQYQERFKEFFLMKRESGIIEVCAHYQHGPAMWGYGMHKGWGQLFRTVGEDPENEVLIIGGTGDKFIGAANKEYLEYVEKTIAENPATFLKTTYDDQYMDGAALVNNLIWDVHIPTIGVINGPTRAHTEFPLCCDLTLCADDVEFRDSHFSHNMVPGDGQYLIFQKLLGDKRANYLSYTGEVIDAQKALDLGLVNEVHRREDLLPRAWEIARSIMEKDRYVRRLTHNIMRQSMRRHFMEDFNLHFAMETWGECLSFMNGRVDVTKSFKKT